MSRCAKEGARIGAPSLKRPFMKKSATWSGQKISIVARCRVRGLAAQPVAVAMNTC